MRDIHESGSGVTLSRTDTGTNPVLPDSDGDFFWDGIEINTGSNANDAGVVPDTFVPIPLLGARAAGALLFLLIGAVLARHRRRVE